MKLKVLLILFLYVIFTPSCSKKSSSDFNSDFHLYKEYITNFTSGLISTKSDFRVILNFEKSDWKQNQVLDDDLFSIRPAIKGKVVALSSNIISFIPENKLDQNTEYQVSFNLKKIIDVPKNLEQFNFTVKTIKQDFIINTLDIQSYNKDYQYLNAEFKTADDMSIEEAEKIISVKYDDQNLKIKFDKKFSTGTHLKFLIDSIQRKIDDHVLEIHFDGSGSKINQKGKIDYTILGKNNFNIVNVEVAQGDSQSLHINFSDPLKKGQDLNGLINVENNNNLRFSFQGNLLKVFFEQPQKGNLLLEVFQGIESEEGFKLKNTYTTKVLFDQIKPGVRFLKSGTILPGSSNLRLNFEAANLKAVDVKIYRIYKNNILQFLQDNDLQGSYQLKRVGQPIAQKSITLKQNNINDYGKWNTYALQLDNLITPEPGAIYRVEFDFKKSYSLYKCDTEDVSDKKNEDQEIINEDDINYSGNNYDYYDDYYDYYDDYDWRERENPCTSSFYYNTKIATNILASDLGVIVKRGENKSYFVAVNNILTTAPVANAKVELYSYQQQLLSTATTNSDGIVNFQLSKFAYFAVVSHNDNTTYVKLDDGMALSVSNFDVSGNVLQKGFKGYVYGERGVWRPGDNIHLGFIFNDEINKLPSDHPIKFQLKDPKGKIEFQKVLKSNQLNHYAVTIPTQADAPTGNWEAMVSVGGAKFYKSIKIETIKPNRLKIKNTFENEVLKSNHENKTEVQVNWLHGAVAKNLKIEVQAKFSKQKTTFKNYSNYNFDDQIQNFESKEINLFSGKLNENGKINFNIKPNINSESPGMLKVGIITKVYEEGGDISTDVASTTYSPYENYVGLKTPETNKYGLLETRKSNKFEVITVSQNGNPVALKNIVVKVYKVSWRWWWDSSIDNLSNFSNSTQTTAYKNFVVSTNASGKGSFEFTVPDEDWGRYLIRIEDQNGGHAASETVLIDYPYWSGKNKNTDASTATMLVFASDKKNYNVGEIAKISFPSSEGGRALISIENGSKIIQTLWANTTRSETKIEIPITSAMAPNVYVNVTLLQPHSNTLNDSPIRMYGIIPLEILDPNTQLQPQITMPDVLVPEQKFQVKVNEKTGKAMTYTIAVVDDGLLDLTRFKTPNAWQSFYSKEALGVKTWDIYDHIIGAYGGKLNQIFSIGGDEDLGGGNAKKANRFKPVVLYYGPFELAKNSSKTHNLQLPKYIGSVRTMIVAADAKTSSYGNAEKTTPVRSPLMILGSLPRKISPGEKVTLPVTVFAMENNIKNVTLSLKTNNTVKIIGNSSQQLQFLQPDEKMAYFNLEVGELTGISKIQIIATSGSEKATYDLEVDVINPNPVTHTYQDVILDPNSNTTLNWETFGITGSNKTQLEISSFPTIDLTRKLDYLISYPHGCLEQTTSSVFPQLYLDDITNLSNTQKSQTQKNITAAIKKLGSMQFANGGFRYWPGDNYVDDWSTSYAGHFLIEAEKKGYILPVQFKSKWIEYQKNQSKLWRIDSRYNNDFAQTYRLYTLAIAGNADLSAMNRLRETVGISEESKLRLAATYAVIGQNTVAQKILSTAKIDPNNSKNNYTYYGSPERNKAMALETLILLNQKSQAFQMANQLAAQMSKSDWMSTQTTAYCLIAMSKFAQQNGEKGINIQYKTGSNSQQIATQKSLATAEIYTQKGRNSITIQNKNNNTLYIRLVNSGILPVGQEIEKSSKLSASVRYFNKNNSAVSIDQIQQGTEIIAEITIKNTTNQNVQNLALTQILPSGFEIINTRFTDYGSNFTNKADYIDIRDDRTNFYFSLNSLETRTFKVLLNASYLGKYYLPGLQCEAMYDNTYLARTQGKWIEVIK